MRKPTDSSSWLVVNGDCSTLKTPQYHLVVKTTISETTTIVKSIVSPIQPLAND
ncbi:hypothetical protein Back11_60970 [Paenibacillus baekrokdamisoli]|uniref:Uncharacterized protein n=1 Tax=Paenibacillus baekrokdamisoli TaxID=1712516 RepID=A0A3G9J2G3_9BACL|nr:hypothetical protein Back11_60970 [Paenibacillus baekrokdamisoli]